MSSIREMLSAAMIEGRIDSAESSRLAGECMNSHDPIRWLKAYLEHRLPGIYTTQLFSTASKTEPTQPGPRAVIESLLDKALQTQIISREQYDDEGPGGLRARAMAKGVDGPKWLGGELAAMQKMPATLHGKTWTELSYVERHDLRAEQPALAAAMEAAAEDARTGLIGKEFAQLSWTQRATLQEANPSLYATLQETGKRVPHDAFN